MNKPLSETHPTLWSKRNGVTVLQLDQIALIQVSTVDVAEHERALSAIAIEKAWSEDREQEVDRLLKELLVVRRELLRMDADLIEQQSVGERRAMNKVKESINKLRFANVVNIAEFEEELGLVEEEKK